MNAATLDNLNRNFRVSFSTFVEKDEAGYPCALVGYAVIKGPKGSYVVRNRLDYRRVHKDTAKKGWLLLTRRAEASGYEMGALNDHLYEIGFFSKFARWVAKTAKKIAQSKLIKGLIKGVKAVLKSPVVAGIVGLASFIPVVGPVLKSGYEASKAGIAKIDQLANAARKGNLAAKKIVAAVAVKAVEGNPIAQNINARVSEVLAQ